MTHRTVHTRRVFYVPGYDPIHPRRYRELYRKEGAAQAAILGYEIALKPKRGGGPFGWHVEAVINDQDVSADVDVLLWSDIVRGSMKNGILATYTQLVRTAWAYIGTGALFRLMRLRQGPVIAALYPIVFLLAQAILALGVGYGLYWAIATYLPGFGIAATALGAVLWIGVAWAILEWFRRRDGKFFAYYLMHDYAFSARYMGANPPALETRIAEFADTIAEALQSDVDEVLVVGHSSGAHLAVSILADLIRAGRVPADGPALGFLSLGQVVPMVSFLPKADRLRTDLRFLSTRDELAWVDVTAPGDGCAFALCDPVGVSGVAPEGKRWPLVFSAQFKNSLSEARWNELKRRYFRLHFQYLCAFDKPLDYDYFQITAGPVTLAERYEGRPPSASRIEHAVSKYTSVAA
jgi:pimeloyl-ACP methyl ester carboxylesterase